MAFQKHLNTISLMEYDTSSFNISRVLKTVVLLLVLFFFLIIFQTSFLAHFIFFGFIPNLVLLVFLIVHILEKPASGLGLLCALVSGMLLDMYSLKPFGFTTALLSAGSLTFTIFKAHYVRLPQF